MKNNNQKKSADVGKKKKRQKLAPQSRKQQLKKASSNNKQKMKKTSSGNKQKLKKAPSNNKQKIKGASSNSQKKIVPPQAKKQDFFHKKFNDQILDPYHWLRNRDTPEVLDYLKRENQYANKKLESLEFLKKDLFKKMKSYLPERQNQEPVPVGDYFYYKTWEKQKQYPVHKRKKKNGRKEEILLDENKIKTKSHYKDVSHALVSPDHNFLGYGLDDQGREFYNIYFKDLRSKQILKHFIPSATCDFIWANDNKTVFYVRQNKKTLRAFQVYRFDIQTGKNQLVFEEKDPKFSVRLNKTICRSWIILVSSSNQTTESYILPAHQPEKDWTLFCPREKKHEYYVFYGENCFYIISNKDQAFNFKLMKVPAKKKQKYFDKTGAYPHSLWQEFIPHRPEVFIEDCELFKNFIALQIRRKGRQEIEVFDKKTKKLSPVKFSEKIYSARLGDNEEYKSPALRIEFQSFTQPAIVYDYKIANKQLQFKSQIKIKGGFQSKNYISKSEYGIAEDGTEIPISIVYKKGIKPNPSSPLLLYAYGSYGASLNPQFMLSLLPLLDRGFVYAMAHVRGGGEKGKKWHEEGKILNKKNTFSDFICSAERLIDQSYTSPSHLYIMGGSAGGLLIGAVLNKRPNLFRGAVASVPFVDCLTTMLDESIPLSTMEYEEWGNPNKKKYYDYIKSYSPYNNIKKTSYPHILIQTGYHDPRVQYWEPAKWTAKLRDCKTNNNLLLLLTNMESGHFGATGRLEFLKLFSLYYSFLIGIEESLIS